jgi:hypothetical protein
MKMSKQNKQSLHPDRAARTRKIPGLTAAFTAIAVGVAGTLMIS